MNRFPNSFLPLVSAFLLLAACSKAPAIVHETVSTEQYTSEKPWDHLEIAVWSGADGRFVLYEDEGDGYGYESGAYSTIEFLWDDASSCLTIGSRKGSFPSMLKERTFTVNVRGRGSVEVTYRGKEMKVGTETYL